MSRGMQIPATFVLPQRNGSSSRSVPQRRASRARRKFFLKAIKQLAVFTRKTVSAVTLAVPLAYFLQFCIDGGMLRQQAFDKINASALMHAIVAPGMKLGSAIFAKPMVDHGWNFMFVVIGAVLFVPRHFIMVPFHRFEKWAKERAKPKPKMEPSPVAAFYAMPTDSRTTKH